ncbi:unnamed protein product [Phytophthora fragariaefolia]|uniref:Unnamed protein product n=1 Tax=Phytophthora fragariaefolia TaxID=1490495 RepID=A0A9W6Y162_9STRA|nr:unnamed protein product [Phytophthora fragariaefolia]
MDESPKSLFESGDREWLYLERVKPGLTMKMARRWHGPVRVKRKVEEYALDFDEELLPEDSWEPDVLGGGYKVESILDDGRPMETSLYSEVGQRAPSEVGWL